MAQRTENEETEFKVAPESILLCVKCGVAGNSVANNLCQKCFNATTVVASTSSAAVEHVFPEKSFRSSKSARSSPEKLFKAVDTSRDLQKKALTDAGAPPPMKRQVNRCFGCKRKVGLTGFRCRCGELFCADHRYTDRHDCNYDYKAAGREAIARENPVVKAAKIVKI